ncbi:MAG: hypothetical protein RLZZ192_116 [Pseudomonadota bacterium]
MLTALHGVLVWHIEPDSITDPARCAEFLSWLSHTERAVHQRFRFDTHRHTYLISHALLRGALSRLIPKHPSEWQFDVNEFGKPHITNGGLTQDIQFNLSHTQGMAVVALAVNREVGIDVEHLGRKETNIDIAERFFAPEEVAELMALPQAQQSTRFLEYWTLKESYIKAIGMGLSCPLESFAFKPKAHQAAPSLIRVDDPLLREKRWAFWQEQVESQHLVALCVQADQEAQFAPELKRADWLRK